jgi:hypothetical protein
VGNVSSDLIEIGLASRVKDKHRRLLDIGKIITVVQKNVRLFDREPLKNGGPNRLGETGDIHPGPLTLGETTLRDEVRGVGNEPPMIIAEVIASHIHDLLRTLQQLLEAEDRVSVVFAEVRVRGKDFRAELSKGGVPGAGLARNILPGLAVATGITNGPVNLLGVPETTSVGEQFNVIKEGVKAGGIGSEAWGITSSGPRHDWTVGRRRGNILSLIGSTSGSHD